MTDQTGAVERARDARGDHGFTLIESLTAAVALLVIASAIIITLISTSDWYATARMRTEAKAVAEQVMTLILSRNYVDIHPAEFGETWQSGAIPATMSWASAVGTFSVETTLAEIADPVTGLPVKRVIVTANPWGRTLTPLVQVIRYASGWQRATDAESTGTVSVEIQIATNRIPVSQEGVRVQLLGTAASDYMTESHYAVTDSSGIAEFAGVPEGQYFLTSDPRFGTDIRPLLFPERIYPVAVGANSVVRYTLEVVRQNTEAVLSVGAFRNEGFFNPVQGVGGNWQWDIRVPYQPFVGASGTRLRIFARPVLNVPGTESVVGDAGDTYPDETKLGPYSGEVNDYGVARIVVPWTIDPAIGQRWEIWCTTAVRNSSGTLVPQPKRALPALASQAPGGWGTPNFKCDLTDQGNAGKLPQFIDLAGAEPVNVP